MSEPIETTIYVDRNETEGLEVLVRCEYSPGEPRSYNSPGYPPEVQVMNAEVVECQDDPSLVGTTIELTMDETAEVTEKVRLEVAEA